MPFSALAHLECSVTSEIYEADRVQGLSRAGAPLLARYDLDQVKRQTNPKEISARRHDLWRYHEVLPVRHEENIVTLGEGMTPVLQIPRYGRAIGLPRLLVKDEGSLPTGTFKARGAAVGVSRAHELGVKGIAMPTNGNAGSAWAAYCSRAGIDSVIAMPVDAPSVTRAETSVVGSQVTLVDGLINDAGRLIATMLPGLDGYQDVSTLKEPYRIEGKKTMGYEIAEQLGWRMPDVILYPTGGGVGLIGIYKALEEMQELGWVDSKVPRLVAVQAAGCAPIVEAFEAGAVESVAASNAQTVAFGINVPKPLGDTLILQAIRATGGTAVAVTDEQLLESQGRVARTEGFFACPETGACFAAAEVLRQSGWLDEKDEVLILSTGAGLKYPDTVPVKLPIVPRP